MALDRITRSAVLRAHDMTVNGCFAPAPDLDSAHEVLTQAHAVLVVATEAARQDSVNRNVLISAFSAIETLMEAGIRALAVGHTDLIAEVH